MSYIKIFNLYVNKCLENICNFSYSKWIILKNHAYEIYFLLAQIPNKHKKYKKSFETENNDEEEIYTETDKIIDILNETNETKEEDDEWKFEILNIPNS
jgi:hypothetical protein